MTGTFSKPFDRGDKLNKEFMKNFRSMFFLFAIIFCAISCGKEGNEITYNDDLLTQQQEFVNIVLGPIYSEVELIKLDGTFDFSEENIKERIQNHLIKPEVAKAIEDFNKYLGQLEKLDTEQLVTNFENLTTEPQLNLDKSIASVRSTPCYDAYKKAETVASAAYGSCMGRSYWKGGGYTYCTAAYGSAMAFAIYNYADCIENTYT